MSLHSRIDAVCLFLLISTPANALVIRGYNANPLLYQRFLNFPTNPSHNTQFLHKAYNLTGVGWHTANSARQVTMVSPLHFVGATHYAPGTNANIRFVSKFGVIRNYTVGSQSSVTNDVGQASDLLIGSLSAPIADGDDVGHHPYLNYNSEFSYYFKTLIVLGKSARGAEGKINAIQNAPSSSLNDTRVLKFNYSIGANGANDCHFESGDSGSPVFINLNGVAAIVGTNSLVTQITPSTTTISNYSNFIPHYISKLNTVMEPDGYRMTKAIPGSTTLTLTHTPPSGILRAGHSFNINLNLDNTGGTMAENVKLVNTLPSGTSISNASGTDWFDESIPTATQARRAKIDTGNDFDYSLTLSIPTPGSHTHSVTYRSDQSGAVTENFTLNVIDSFVSWAAGLTDQSATGDDDLDGVSNLLEYAFGGDPATASLKVSGETVNLLPEISQSGAVRSFSYVRRKDFVQRALTYSLTSSTTLQTGSFTDATTMISNTQTTSINADLELVTLTLTGTGTERFFRIEVELDEA